MCHECDTVSVRNQVSKTDVVAAEGGYDKLRKKEVHSFMDKHDNTNMYNVACVGERRAGGATKTDGNNHPSAVNLVTFL